MYYIDMPCTDQSQIKGRKRGFRLRLNGGNVKTVLK